MNFMNWSLVYSIFFYISTPTEQFLSQKPDLSSTTLTPGMCMLEIN